MSRKVRFAALTTYFVATVSAVHAQSPTNATVLEPIVVTGQRPAKNKARAVTVGSKVPTTRKKVPLARKKVPQAASVVADNVTVLDPIEVTGQRPDLTEGTGKYTASAVTVGSKIPVAPKEVPQTVSVIADQQIKEQNLVTLTDVLQNTPGVTVVSNNTFMSQFYSRGFALTTVQQDGVALEYTNNQGYGPLDLAMYDHIEVLRGPSGLFTGAGQPSGTVNMIRKRAQDQFAITSDLSIGSYNSYRGMVDVTGPLNEAKTVRGRLVTSLQDNDYFYDTAHNRNVMLYGTIEADLTPDTLLRFGASYQKNNATPMGGLPAYSNGRLLSVPRSTFVGADWGRRPAETANPFFELTHRFDNDWKFRFAGDYFYQDTDWIRAYPTGSVNPATNTFPGYYGARTHYTDKQTSLDASLSGPMTLFGREHQLIFGLNWRNEDYFYSPGQTVLIRGPFNIYNLSPSIPMPASLPFRSKSDTDTTQWGAYASARISLADPLTLVLGGRVSWFDAKTQVVYPTIQAPTKYGEDAVFTPYAALIYNITKDLSAYASYTSIFQPQNLQTYDGQLLSPVKGQQYEVGLKQSLFDGRLEASAAVFLIKQTNTAQSDNNHAGYYLPSGGEIESKGVDLQLTGRILPNWNITAGYTYNPTKYTKDQNYQGQPYSAVTPEHIFRLWTNYDIEEGTFRNWSVGMGVNAVSEFGNNGYTQSAYATLGARVAYKINEHVTAALNLDNITNTKYYQTVGASAYNNNYGAPFNATLSLRAKF